MSTVDHPVVHGAALGPAFKAVSLAMPRKANKPVLRNVSLSTGPQCMSLHCNNLETCIHVTVGDCPSESMIVRTLVPASAVYAVAGNKGTTPLTVEPNAVCYGGMRFVTEDPMEYPVASSPMYSMGTVTLPLPWVAMVRDAVAVAADNESSRYALGAVLLDTRDGITAVGTDGRRLHALHLPVDGAEVLGKWETAATPEPLIPAAAFGLFHKAVSAVVKALPKPMQKSAMEGSFTLAHEPTRHEAQFTFSCGPITLRLTTRTVEGRFPRWRDVMKDENACHPAGRLVCDATQQQVREATRATSESSKGVKLSGRMLTAQAAGVGEYSAPFLGGAGVDHLSWRLDPRFWCAAMDACMATGATVCSALVQIVADPIKQPPMVTFAADASDCGSPLGVSLKVVVCQLAAD